MQDYSPEPRYFNVFKQPVIGKSCSLVNTLLDCSEQIVIGDYVSFGHDVQLLCGSHEYTLKGKERQDSILRKPITIKDGAWICSRVIIFGGVTIGENAVIGAGSVVTHNVPDNEMWFGIPAVFHKKI